MPLKVNDGRNFTTSSIILFIVISFLNRIPGKWFAERFTGIRHAERVARNIRLSPVGTRDLTVRHRF